MTRSAHPGPEGSAVLNVLCVKWGTKYPADYVNRLRSMVSRNLPLPHRFVCLTDDAAGLERGIETLPFLQTDLEYCWNKLLLFDRLPLEGVGLYLDLDVVVTGDLTPIATTRPSPRVKQPAFHSPAKVSPSSLSTPRPFGTSST